MAGNVVRSVVEWTDKLHFEFESLPLSSPLAPSIACGVYLLSIWLLSRRRGPALVVRTWERLHNALLLALSAVTAVGVYGGAMQRARDDGGLISLVCSPRRGDAMWNGAIGAWTYVFYLLKYLELLDTVILALKKKPLLPLHLYHHAIMLFVAWSWFAYPWLEGSWFCAWINSVIHTAMYQYYFSASFGRRVWWKKHLTGAQIVQFVSGIVYVAAFYVLRYRGHGCGGNVYTSLFSLVVNYSFLALFLAFYESTYSKAASATDAAATSADRGKSS